MANFSNQVPQNNSFNTLTNTLAAGGVSPLGLVTSFIGPLLSGPTGAAGVTFENERRIGKSNFYNAKVFAKVRDFETMFVIMGKSLTDFGWRVNEVPSSASANFKKAEDWFWLNLPLILTKLKETKTELPLNFQDDKVIVDYYNNIGILGSVTNVINTVLGSQNSTFPDVEPTNGVSAVNDTSNIFTKKYMGFPIWSLVIVGYILLRKK